VEHPCYKCGASVEDGTPFCPRCSAPQIRVVGPEIIAPVAATLDAVAEPYASYSIPQPAAIEWSHALPSSGISLLAAFCLIMLGVPPGLGMVAAGFLSVVLYRRRNPGIHLTAGKGARLGALTGTLGFGVLAIILALVAAFQSGTEIRDTLLRTIQQYAAHSTDPHIQQVLDLAKTPEGFTFIMILSFAMTFVAFLMFSSLGAAIGAFLLYRKERR
jgi:hypothetical protein